MYTVYENRVRKYVRVHMASCGHVRKHGGGSSTTAPASLYHEGFDTLGEAEMKASAIGYSWRTCSVCLPEGRVGELPGEEVQGRWGPSIVVLLRALKPSPSWWRPISSLLDLAKGRWRRR